MGSRLQYSRALCACGCGGHPRNRKAEYIAGHRPKADPIPRFWGKVNKSDGCWVWTGAIGSHGYGTFWDGTAFFLAHRYSLLIAGRLLDPDLHVDHLCRNKPCVRPEYLELVAQLVNNLRALRYRPPRDHCKWGHAFAETGFINSNGYRECRECVRAGRCRHHARS
jgi:hypothetical protein